jgi:glycerophosphoryl diester phosphodiesterase
LGACGESSPARTAESGAGGNEHGGNDAAIDRNSGGNAPSADATSDPTMSSEQDAVVAMDATPATDATMATDAAAGLDVAMSHDGPERPLTVEALQVIGTHNSYHKAPTIAFDASHKYTHLPLDQQFAGGVRAIELDLHLRSDGVFEVYHISIIDPNSTCATFDACLGVVATWSAAHPRHVPIFIWLELKDDTGGQPINDLVAIETVISKVFARERLITAAWLKGSYASPHERILGAGWPTLDETRGKVMFAIINRDDRTKAYAHDFTSLDDRLMFVNAAADQLMMSWASITKVDDVGQTAIIANAHAAHLIVATNVCAVNMNDDECTMLLGTGISGGIHMLHDDLPFPVSGRTYHAALPGGSPGCNPVTAPAGCMANQLE